MASSEHRTTTTDLVRSFRDDDTDDGVEALATDCELDTDDGEEAVQSARLKLPLDRDCGSRLCLGVCRDASGESDTNSGPDGGFHVRLRCRIGDS